MLRITLLLSVLTLTSTFALACPDISGKYVKVPGSDQFHNVEDPGGLVRFPSESFTVVRDGICEASLHTKSGKIYNLTYVPSQRAYMNTSKIGWYVFKLSLETYVGTQLYLRYSRTRNFLTGVAPVYSHTAQFERVE